MSLVGNRVTLLWCDSRFTARHRAASQGITRARMGEETPRRSLSGSVCPSPLQLVSRRAMQTPKPTIGRTLVSVHDLRSARRYRLSEVVSFSWNSEDGSVTRHTGVTQDISIRGICFVAACHIDIGTRISLDIFLVSVNRSSQAIRLHADGFICRIEYSGTSRSGYRIAAEIAFQEDPDEIFLASTEVQ